MNKKCPCCKETKSISDFGVDKNTKSGFNVYCKLCVRFKVDAYRKSKRGKSVINLRARLKRFKLPDKVRKRFRDLKRKYNATAAGKYWNLKNQANKNGNHFDILQKDFENWFNSQTKVCFYCHEYVLFGQGGHGNFMNALTIDRKDNTIGYILSNIVIACRRCNTIKGGWFSHRQMLAISKKYLRKK